MTKLLAALALPQVGEIQYVGPVEDNKGTGAKSTRGRQWELLYVEKFFTRGDAMSREWYLKRDRKFRKSLLKNWAS